jgi:hypothetical protein
MSEFGYEEFGVDYGQLAYAWILQNYAPITDPRSSPIVLRRRGPVER